MKNENTENTVESTEVTITVGTPETSDVQIKAAPKAKAKKQSDAEKINLLEKAAKKAGNDITVTIAPRSKKPAASKKAKVETKADAMPGKAKVEVKAKDAPKPETKVEMPAPLKVDKKLFDEKVEKLNAKLEKEKRETTKSPFHISYGFFVAKAKSGRVLVLEYHEALKSNKWLLRDPESKKVLTEPMKTMHGLHEKAIREF